MKKVKQIVFRFLTHDEFFALYKPARTETRGGGQSYIDFPKSAVSANDWQGFFDGVTDLHITERAQGPAWTFPVYGIGLPTSQRLTMSQRRASSVNVTAQKITSRNHNRVAAWHPDNGFPEPYDPTDRQACPPHLAIFLAKVAENEIWAGWFQDWNPCRNVAAADILEEMLNDRGDGHAGLIVPQPGSLLLDVSDTIQPFEGVADEDEGKTRLVCREGSVVYGSAFNDNAGRAEHPESELLESLFSEDQNADSTPSEASRETIRQVRTRNTKAVADLKKLYLRQCQLTGAKHCFPKKNGELYCEAHHLIPLGDQGADSLFNIIIVSPLIHRMLHYANVQGLNLGDISAAGTLDILINGEPFTIKWHPRHVEVVRRFQE